MVDKGTERDTLRLNVYVTSNPGQFLIEQAKVFLLIDKSLTGV